MTQKKTARRPSQKPDEEQEHRGCGTVGVYKPRGTAYAQYYYFRFSYCLQQEGKRKFKHRHIPGGNITCAIAQQRATQVRAAVKRGDTLMQVLALIQGFAGSTG